jgi:probable rRNA maturation factor
MSIILRIEEDCWRPFRLQARLGRAIRAALTEVGAVGSLSLLLADDDRLHVLNKAFRGKDAPTNVLSFPSVSPGYLGDIAIAFAVTAQEAGETGKTLADHAVHLAVHGTLHLTGFDHVLETDARRMEALETKILQGLGIADPYVIHSADPR